jgi:hypothetical protein
MTDHGGSSGDLIAVAAIIFGFGITVFMFRIQREVSVQEKGWPSWLAWSDYLVISSVLLVACAAVIPLMAMAPAGGRTEAWASAACVAALLLQIGYIPAILAHYRIEIGTKRTGKRAKGEPAERWIFGVSFLVATVAFVWVLCRPGFGGPNVDQAAKRYSQPPTATAVFTLRTKCAAELGETFLANPPANAPGVNAGSLLTTYYNPSTNRCYVKLSTAKNDYLYDGQTRELLAYTGIQQGGNVGRVLPNGRSLPASLGIASGAADTDTYDFAKELIDRAVVDDRTQ